MESQRGVSVAGELHLPDASGFYPQHGGGWIVLGPLDSEGRATFAMAAVTLPMVEASRGAGRVRYEEDIERHGFPAGSHLIADILDALPREARRFVSQWHEGLHGGSAYRRLETRIRDYALTGGTAQIRVQPLYKRKGFVPSCITVRVRLGTRPVFFGTFQNRRGYKP